MNRNIEIKSEIFKEEDQYVAICYDLNISSFGNTPEKAKESLKEAAILFFEECERMGTLDEVLEEAGYTRNNSGWQPPSPILTENLPLQV